MGGKLSAAGKNFRNHLCSCMRHLDFVSCPANPNVWMRPAKRSDGSDYYDEYILLYTDDALVVDDNTEQVLPNELG
jgi:hypothetical protein